MTWGVCDILAKNVGDKNDNVLPSWFDTIEGSASFTGSQPLGCDQGRWMWTSWILCTDSRSSSLLGFPHGVSMTVCKPKCGDAHLTPWPVLELSLIYCCLFIMCACMCQHAHATACMRRSEDSLLRLVLFPPCGSWRSNSGISLGSEHPSLSHLAGPLLCLLFSLLFMETTPEHKALMHRRVFQRLHSERLT